ncbi:hypothetical protein [Burkholderia sp. LMU1-1-1.1]|uniref:hypothetical protein n=1 Tax=Burkholderia sp. LMU1-1-1.1 TaxID=3135266 RepID=UPI0034374CFB
MNDLLHLQSHPNGHSLVIPVDPESLGSFISGLLGRPQTIEKRIFGEFDLNKAHLIDLFCLVDQRISQQNKGQLIQFSLNIIYSDDSSVLLNGLSDFESYRDVNDKISVAAELAWTYLIKFEDKQTAEKQSIELSINTARKESMFSDASINLLFPSIRYLRNSFHLRIQHTARTWGTDIEHLITGKLNTFVKKEHWLPRIIHTYNGLVGLALALIFLGLAIYGIYAVSAPFSLTHSEAAKYAQALTMDQKLNYLIDEISSPSWKRIESLRLTFGFVAFLLSVVVGIVAAALANNPPKSYLALSSAAEAEREEFIKARKLDWMYFIVSAVVSTSAGVASRYIYRVFFES